MADGKPQTEEGSYAGKASSDVEEKALEVEVTQYGFFCIWAIDIVFGSYIVKPELVLVKEWQELFGLLGVRCLPAKRCLLNADFMEWCIRLTWTGVVAGEESHRLRSD